MFSNRREGLCSDCKMADVSSFQRSLVAKVVLREIVEGTYVQESEQQPNYLFTTEGKKIYRANIIAVIVNKQKIGSITNLLLDDSTGKMTLRFFEEQKNIEEINMGDVVLVIGRIRIFNNEKYLSAEIMRRVEPLWLKVRSWECEKKGLLSLEEGAKEKNQKRIDPAEEVILEKGNFASDNNALGRSIQEDVQLPFQKIIKIIKELDQGEGVLIEEVITKSMLGDSEKILEKMLVCGEIFQNLPGRVKVNEK